MNNFAFLLESTGSTGSGLGSTILMIAVFGIVIYFFMIRPQKKQEKEAANMRNSLEIGDEVVTIGGIMGTVDTVKEDHFVVRISDNARIKVLKNAVSQIVRPEAANAEPEKK